MSSYDGSGDTILTTDIIPACSTFLDNYCNRDAGGFLTQSYDQIYHGTRTNQIYLRNAPIQSISRIAGTQIPAFWVRCNDGDIATRATVQITSTEVTLTYINGTVNSGSPVVTNLTFATYPTVSQMVTAINAAGNFWEAGVSSGMNNRMMNDIWVPQGSYGARITTCYAWLYWYDLPIFTFDPNKSQAEVYSPMGFYGGVWNWRVTYSAGYASFPADITQALCELCVGTYYSRQLNPNAFAENIGPMSYTRFNDPDKVFQGLSDISRKTINRYRLIQVPKFSIL